MNRRWLLLAIAVCGTPGLAHHSFAMFDTTRTVELAGTVRAFEWTNPHIWIQLQVADSNGSIQEWSIEGPSPNRLGREGWKSGTLKAGDRITVTTNPLRSGQPGGALVRVKFADGRVMGPKSANPDYSADKAQ
jgi:hypothetical protein